VLLNAGVHQLLLFLNLLLQRVHDGLAHLVLPALAVFTLQKLLLVLQLQITHLSLQLLLVAAL
jgi:hypothetical protein